MNVVVFGASGKTGREVVERALDRGHVVTAFVRDPQRLGITHPNLHIVQGDVSDSDAVAKGLVGQDAAISTLGVSKPLKPDPVVVTGVQKIVERMESSDVPRFIYLSAILVGESLAASGFFLRNIGIRPLRYEIADHTTKEEIVKGSSLDWTIVHAPKLNNGKLTGKYRSGESITSRSFLPLLSRADVADFLVEQLTDNSFIRKTARLLP